MRAVRLSILIPLLLVLSSVASSTLLFWQEIRVADHNIQQAGVDNLNASLTELQNVLTSQLADANLDDAKLSLSASALHPGVRTLLLADQHNTVLFANRYIWVGSSASQVCGYADSIAQQVRQTQASSVSLHGSLLQGYCPVMLRMAPGNLELDRVGILFAEYDLGPQLARAEHDAANHALSLGGLMVAVAVAVALLLDRLVSRRVKILVEAFKRLAAGDLNVRVNLRGSDELAELGVAFDDMAGQRQRVEEELRKHRNHLEEMIAQRTRELTAAKDAAEAASGAKSDFLSSMSHELRTPLNAILGYTQILKPQENLTSRQREQLDVMYTSGEHLLTLIGDILDLSRIEAHRLELVEAPFCLPRLLEQVLEIAKVRADQKNLELQYEVITALPEYVRGDEGRVRQILLNLLSNAVKFTRHGSVTLRVRYDQTDAGWLNCEVADTGIGIPEDRLEAIFEPFTQLTTEGQGREGAGLGLTITRRLASLMGGGASAESQLGEGSTFRFWAPLSASAAAEPLAKPTHENIRGYRGPRKRVLVVDDTPANAQLLVDILQPLGFETTTAHGGREALRQAQEQPPDLVLLDLVMPEMDGIETARAMREHPQLKAMPIIGVSATVTASGRKRAFAALCDGFLSKPIRVGELLQMLGRLLQLEWDIASPDAAVPAGDASLTATVPPPEVLETLRRTVQRGEFGELERLLKEHVPDTAHSAFCQRIRRLAASYDDDGIVGYIDELGKAHDDSGNN